MDVTEVSLLITVFILLTFSAFFSAAETAYSTVSRIKIEEDINAGKKVAKLIKKQYKSFGWTLATILLSNNVVNVGLSSITAYLFSGLFTSGPTSALISTAIVTPILVIFGEIVPKLFAKKFAYSYLRKIAYILQFLNILFLPLTYPLSKLTLGSSVTNTEKDLSSLLDIAKKEKVLEPHEATLAQRALKLDSTLVGSAMTKKKEIVTINYKDSVLKAKKLFQKSGHSRIIVKNGNKYVGVLLLKDILFSNEDSDFERQIKPLVFVSENKLISKALEKMRINWSHIAIVVKKKNSENVTGLITIEDILEELVGELYDEHDRKESIREIAHFKYVVDGSTLMKKVEKELKYKFDDVDDLTIRQWVQSRIQRTIKKGLRYEYKDEILFKIIANKKREDTLIEIIVKQ